MVRMINAVNDWDLDLNFVREKLTEDGRYFSGDERQVWVIITPKGEILSAQSCCGTRPLLRSELSQSNPSPPSLRPSPRLDELLPRSRLLSVPFHLHTHRPTHRPVSS